jgi:outer membrane protein OmpA-like peptidoglycan-associated protein/Mg-chelatase subunit ChlD
MKVLSSLIFLIILSFAACTTYNYNYVPQPLFLKEQALQNNQRVESANLNISRVENNSRTVRLHVHLMDSAGVSYNNIATNNNIWCGLTDYYGGTLHQITDFKVFENREEENVPTAYALVLDHSGSMSGRVKDMQDAVEMFIRNKRPEDAIAIVKYDKIARIEVPSSTDLNFLLNNFRKNGLSGYGGLTAIQNGNHEGIQSIINTPFRRKVVISFTDGGDNSSTITGDYVKWLAQSNNIIISTIDLGRSVSKGYMQDIAMATGGTYNYMMYASEFPNVFKDIQNRLSKSYIIEYNSPGFGAHDVHLKACLSNMQLSANAQYNNTPIAQVAPVRDAALPANLPASDGKPFNPPRSPRPTQSVKTASTTQSGTSVKNTPRTANNSVKPTTSRPGSVKQTPAGTNTGNAGQVQDNSNNVNNPSQVSTPAPAVSENVKNPNQSNVQSSSGSSNVKNPNQSNVQNSAGSANVNTPNRANAQNSEGESNVKNPSSGGIKKPGNQASGSQPNVPTNPSTGRPLKASIQNFNASSKPTRNSSFLLELEFKPGSAEIILETRSQQLLDQLAATIKSNNRNVRIESHTDNSFDASLSLNISNDRANVIKQQLVQRGVQANKIQTLGKGSTEPIADNATAEGRKQNNRHVVVFN